MTARHDDSARRAYDAANATLDEAPPADARAAILAQAARAVQAQPRLAGSPAPARARWRVPFAAAATVLVGVLAVQLAMRTERETVVSEAGAPPGAAKQGAPAEARAPQAQQGAVARGAAETEATRTQPKVADQPRAPVAAPSVTQAPAVTETPAVTASPRLQSQRRAEAADSAGAASSERRREADASGVPSAPAGSLPAPTSPPPLGTLPAPPPPPEVAPASPVPSTANAPTPQGGLSAQEAVPRAAARQAPTPPASDAPAPRGESAARAASGARESRAPETAAMRDEAERQEKVTAAPVRRAAPRADAAAPAETPPAWLERIGRLREAGRHDEADAELVKFRSAHPDVQVPPGLLR